MIFNIRPATEKDLDTLLSFEQEIVKTEMSTAGRLDSAQAELELQTDLVEKLHGLLDRSGNRWPHVLIYFLEKRLEPREMPSA